MTRYRGRHTAAWLASTQGGVNPVVRPGNPRVRRGTGATAVAALAMAALTASQAPGVELPQAAADDEARTGSSTSLPDGTPGDGSYHTELPPLESPTPPRPSATPEHSREGKGAAGIPATVLAAYRQAEASVGDSDPGCALPWELLAAIGKVESGQARGGAVDANGTTLKPILGPVLNGDGFANIIDTDQGVFDGDTVHDRAIGPMQFIPSTWSTWGADGNADGRRDPNNVFDAALAAGHYLCAGERKLSVKDDLDKAILSYNHSGDYLRTVLSWLDFYRDGVHEVPDGDGILPTSPGAGGIDEPGDGPGNEGARHPKRPATPDEGKKKPSDPPQDDRSTEPDDDATHSTGTPTPTPTPTETTPTPTPTPTETTPTPAVPAELARFGEQELTAQRGKDFTAPVQVRLTGDDGEVMPGERVVFTLGGATGSTFADGKATATATTDEQGVATSPVLHAGGTSGELTVHAVVEGHETVATDVTATVLDPRADTLTSAETAYTAEAGATFTPIAVTATWHEAVAAGVKVTATLYDEHGDVVTQQGPCFPAAEGTEQPRHSLSAVTDDNGVLTLSKLTAGDTEGTYTLRLTTADTAKPLVVTLTVTAPADDATTAAPAP